MGFMLRLSGLVFLLVLFCLPLVSIAQVNTPYPLNKTQYLHWQQQSVTSQTGQTEGEDSSRYEFAAPKEDFIYSRAARKEDSNKDTQPSLSPLEEAYSGRVVDQLRQFGYDLFGVPSPQTRAYLNELAKMHPPSGAVADDFVLGSGDELEVVFTGQRTDRTLSTVNSQGLLIIEDFPPIPAAGRTIAQVRLSVENAARHMHNTKAYISLSRVRQIGALVIGHVKKPGHQTLTVFHTVLDALMGAGGISKTGSLRQIKLVRDGRSTFIDLYALLMHGSPSVDMTLRSGDRIIVPAIGPTVAIAGEAKRPGIYEILPRMKGMYHKPAERSEKLSLNEMLELGGGVLSPGRNRFMKLGIGNGGGEQVSEITQGDEFAPQFGDGSILMISKGEEKRSGMVELKGHTRRPGLFALKKHPSLSDLLSNNDILGENIYPLIGAIKRWDKDQLTHKFMGFPLRLVLKEQFDRKLQDEDEVILFSNDDIRRLPDMILASEETKEESTEQGSRPDAADSNHSNNVHSPLDDPGLASFLKERSAFIRGAVRYPGTYPVAEGVTLDSLIAVAGGLTLEANTGNIEITSAPGGQQGRSRQSINYRETNPADVMIEAGDAVRVNRKFKAIEDKSVLILGEVANPGRYDLLAGDKISDLVVRAGGLTQHAYPDGAIFSRKSERKAEEMRFRAQARQIKQAVAAALESDDSDINEGKIAEARALADELEDAQGIGRITIEADPAVLSVEPELDMLLQEGDRLFIPRRDLSVRVRGEVLSPASLQFREDKNARDYIREGGGFTFHADKRRSFILLPDGSAQPLESSVWSHRGMFIPPGSTIVVPRDPEPFDFIQSAKDISQILSNLAVTAIFIDDVRDDD